MQIQYVIKEGHSSLSGPKGSGLMLSFTEMNIPVAQNKFYTFTYFKSKSIINSCLQMLTTIDIPNSVKKSIFTAGSQSVIYVHETPFLTSSTNKLLFLAKF